MQSSEVAQAIADAVEVSAGETKFAPDASDVDVYRPYPKQQAWFDIEVRKDGKRDVYRVSVRKQSTTDNGELPL
jgi:hypothetical protein